MSNNRLMLESACDFYFAHHLDIILNEIGVISACVEKTSDMIEPIHRLRTSSRRILEIEAAKNRFLSQHTGKSLKKSVHRLLSISGRLRNLDVMLSIVQELQNAPDISSGHSDALAAFLLWLEQQRGITALQFHEALDNSLKNKLAKAVQYLRDICLIGYDVLSDEGYTLNEAAPAIFYTAAADILSAARQSSQLHKLRIMCKGFRYILELFELAGIDSAKYQTEFKLLQDALGSWHDDYVLLGQLKKFGISSHCTDEYSEVLKELFSQRERLSHAKSEAAATMLEQSWFDSAFAGMFLTEIG